MYKKFPDTIGDYDKVQWAVIYKLEFKFFQPLFLSYPRDWALDTSSSYHGSTEACTTLWASGPTLQCFSPLLSQLPWSTLSSLTTENTSSNISLTCSSPASSTSSQEFCLSCGKTNVSFHCAILVITTRHRESQWIRKFIFAKESLSECLLRRVRLAIPIGDLLYS